MSWNAKWRPEWDSLLGTMPDGRLAKQLGVRPGTVHDHRIATGTLSFSGKQLIGCSYCPATMWRKQIRPVNTCRKCMLAKTRIQSHRWHEAHKGQHDSGAWWRNHPEERKAYLIAYREKNRKKLRRYHRRYARNRSRQDKQLLADLPCMECGSKHTIERREQLLRRLLPCTVREIREIHPCLWGPPDESNSKRERELYRDLHRLGAVRLSGTWYPASESRAA
jgi:hypothetical protein